MIGIADIITENLSSGQNYFNLASRYSKAGCSVSQLLRLSAPDGIEPPCTGLLINSYEYENCFPDVLVSVFAMFFDGGFSDLLM